MPKYMTKSAYTKMLNIPHKQLATICVYEYTSQQGYIRKTSFKRRATSRVASATRKRFDIAEVKAMSDSFEYENWIKIQEKYTRLSVWILDGWIVFFNKNTLNELHRLKT